MATFRVGQRVRIVRVKYRIDSLYIGQTGTIVDHDGKPASDGKYYPIDVLMDVPVRKDRARYCAESWELEPIQPEGNSVVAWSECLWQPEEMREGVT